MKKYMESKNRLRHQEGLSLIGLIVGIAVAASFLLLISQMYSNSIYTERYQEARSALLEEGRFILDDVRRITSIAGLDISNSDVINEGSDGLQLNVTTSKTQDHIVVAFRRSGSCRDSAGTSATTTNNTELFYNSGKLQCRDNTGAAPGTGAAVTLTNNINAFRVLYGVDSNDDGYPNRYVDDQELQTSGVNLNTVRSMRVGFLLNSGDFLVSPKDEHGISTYDLLGEEVTIDLTSDDNSRRLFGVYETTIYLRNLSNAVIRFTK